MTKAQVHQHAARQSAALDEVAPRLDGRDAQLEKKRQFSATQRARGDIDDDTSNITLEGGGDTELVSTRA
jgi:hypothetical protein